MPQNGYGAGLKRRSLKIRARSLAFDTYWRYRTEELTYARENLKSQGSRRVISRVRFRHAAMRLAFISFCSLAATYSWAAGDPTQGDPCHPPGMAQCGDPINPNDGNLYREVTDYETAGPNKLTFKRYYNHETGNQGVFGFDTWSSEYDANLFIFSSTEVDFFKADGKYVPFFLNNGVWTCYTDIDLRLTQSGSTWTLTDWNDEVTTFVGAGIGSNLLPNSIRSRSGYARTMQYDSSGRLSLVTDSYGRALTFAYATNRVSVTTPDATTLTYSLNFQSGGNILSLTYSTNPPTSQTYQYVAAGGFSPLLLSGVVDENGNQFTSWTYDPNRRATSSQGAGGSDLTQLTYTFSGGNTTVTNVLGEQEVYKFGSSGVSPINKVKEIDRLATSSTAAAQRLFTYDSHGYFASETDWNGNLTTYVNDSHGQPTTITEAAGTPQQRITQITYSPTFRLPTQIVTPGLTISLTYDGNGNLVSRTEADTTSNSTSGQTRTWTYTRSDTGLPLSATDPRGITTRFGWDSSGALVSITNALGQVTQITQHTGGGRPQTIVDPNGVVTNLTYDARQRLVSKSVNTANGPLITNYTYDAVGNLTRISLPDGSTLANTYDAAHRLVAITDLFNQQMQYALDAAGDRTQTITLDPSGSTMRLQSATFDSLGRVLTDSGGAGQTTSYIYDSNGNRTQITDPLGRITNQGFDALNRLVRVTDPAQGVTTSTYDARDQLTGVTDPNGNTTTYAYDGFGDVISQVSPDSGTTVFSYDGSGNLVQRVDARGAVTNYVYDTLNRLTAKTFPAHPAENIIYTYDEAGHGFSIGRLTTVVDNGGQAGSVSYTYDERGNVLSEARTRGAATLNTSYTYDAAGRVSGITYPSGAVAHYTRDAMGRITALTVTPPGGSALPVVSNVSYQPFGPVSALTYGNGITDARTFDLDYRPTGITYRATTHSWNLGYSYDLDNNVTAVTDNVFGNQSFGYDQLNRLVQASGWYGSGHSSYDPIGNVSFLAGESMGYAAGTNRLASVSIGSTTVRSLGYTATGNITADQRNNKTLTLGYNQANRLASVMVQPTGNQQTSYTYIYDAAGQRLAKLVNGSGGTLTVYQHDRAGHLLEETDLTSGTPKPLADYLYLDGRPVGILTFPGGVLYLHTDRLGTPQAATTASQQVVWADAYNPLGGTKPLVNLVPQNLRFPGQYADSETGYYHNGFRDYDPTIGRYLESDPIGLSGGLNTYAYAKDNPTTQIDPTGLDSSFAPPQTAHFDPSSPIPGDIAKSQTHGPSRGSQPRRHPPKAKPPKPLEGGAYCASDEEEQEKAEREVEKWFQQVDLIEAMKPHPTPDLSEPDVLEREQH